MLLVLRCALAGLRHAAAAGCSQAGTRGRSAGVLRVAVAAGTQKPQSAARGDDDDGFIDRLMFEPLLTADPRGNPLPMLAARVPTKANGGISRDGLTIVYHLARRRQMERRRSRYVAATCNGRGNAIVNPNNNVISRHGYDVVRAIDTPDAHTVVVHLKQPLRAVRQHVLRRERSAVRRRAGARAFEVSEHQSASVQRKRRR